MILYNYIKILFSFSVFTLKVREKSYDLNFNQNNRDKWIKKVAKSLPKGTKILDVGAGLCQYRKFFEHCEYKTQDFCQYKGTKNGLMKDEWRYGTIDYVCDSTSIPVPDVSFDAILCSEVLEHIPEPIKAIKEFSRILKKNGKLFLTAPLGSGLHQQPYHYYGGFTPHFYKKYFKEFGFKVIEITSNGGLLKHFIQESGRVEQLLKKKNYNRKFISYFFSHWIPAFLYNLDKEIFAEEFTVGYFVAGEKK